MPDVVPLPLARLTTLQSGAAPDRMLVADTRDELVSALRGTWDAGEDWLVLGGGSNLFVGDEPFAGVVVRVATSGVERVASPVPGRVRLRVEAGHGWDDLVAQTVSEGLAGIEALSGIPGTVGAAPVQNIGAYGQEIVETLVEVDLLDAETGEISVVPAADLGLGFRTSVLKHHYGAVPVRPGVILSVTLELMDVGPGPRLLESERLHEALRIGPDERPTLAEIRERVLRTRAAKGMVLDPDDPDTASAGSFFQNPIVSAEFAASLPADAPRWPVTTPDAPPLRVIPLDSYAGLSPRPVAAAPDVKLSAAWLIEQAGISRGFALPRSRARVSTKHALALTNRGGASAAELAELARFIQQRVASEFGLVLQPEPVLVGVDL